jgi:glucose/arabinose dehydrogenase
LSKNLEEKMRRAICLLICAVLLLLLAPLMTLAAPPFQEGTPTIEATTEATAEATVEATAETTAEATSEATVEATTEATATVEATAEPTQPAEAQAVGVACQEDYSVQADDWLSKIADKYYGNILAYPAIFEATNAKAAEDASYATIANPDLIEPGWKLCIVSPEEATAMLGGAATPGAGSAPAETPAAAPAEAAQKIMVGLELVAEGLTSPIALVSPDDGTGRRFIVDQTGLIRILMSDGNVSAEPFLDARDRMVELTPEYDERGLLGLAFHPNFQENGRFFVYYSAPLREGAPQDWDHTSHISEFTVSSENPGIADPASERILLQVDQPQDNHNAGQIAFGPDGYLYIPLGDGGGANDVDIGHSAIGNGQDLSNLLGSILRIDVDNGDPYGIPADNPFRGQEGSEEIFAYGFRNPFRISFDSGGNGDLFVSDAGQDQWEEVSIVTNGGNYGWNIKEASFCFDPQNPTVSPETCADVGANGEPLIDPIIQYKNANAPDGVGFVVIGGLVYRGSALPELSGRYIFGDWSRSMEIGDGSLFTASAPTSAEAMWVTDELLVAPGENGRIGAFVLSFGQDADGELYVLTTENMGPSGNTGKVFKLVPVS